MVCHFVLMMLFLLFIYLFIFFSLSEMEEEVSSSRSLFSQVADLLPLSKKLALRRLKNEFKKCKSEYTVGLVQDSIQIWRVEIEVALLYIYIFSFFLLFFFSFFFFSYPSYLFESDWCFSCVCQFGVPGNRLLHQCSA